MVDRERIRTRFGRLEADLQDLADRQAINQRDYRNDRDVQAIVERRFETAIQACLDIAAHLIAAEGYREPTDYGDLFRILEAEGVLPSGLADRMVEMAGFRNALAHEYAEIDHERVHAHLQDLEHFRAFVREVSAFLEPDG